jgi:uncharacterized membrane protein
MTDARSTLLPTALDRVGQTEKLDQVVAPIEQLVGRVPPAIRRKLSGVDWLGHPLHQPLVHLPLGSWMAAGVMDLAGKPDTARDLTALGLASAVPAALAGWADWAELSPDNKRTGVVHAAAIAASIALYAGSLAARCSGHRRLGQKLGLLGLTVVGVGGAIGGDLALRRSAALAALAAD